MKLLNLLLSNNNDDSSNIGDSFYIHPCHNSIASDTSTLGLKYIFEKRDRFLKMHCIWSRKENIYPSFCNIMVDRISIGLILIL